MTQSVQQWLAEIRSLQNQLVNLRQDLDEAYRSAANWRSLYEMEAKQRRADVAELKQVIEQLRQEPVALPSNIRVQEMEHVNRDGGESQQGAIADAPLDRIELDGLSENELTSLLLKALTDCSRLQQALEREKAEHIKTRQSLMSALGDTVDLLTKERVQRQNDGKISNEQKLNAL